VDYLKKLYELVGKMLHEPTILQLISELKEQLIYTDESFVWSIINHTSVIKEMPSEIKSAWVFILKKDVASGCHYHPNSVQHMIMIEGVGESRIGGKFEKIKKYGSPDTPIKEIWYVIDKGVEHEFFPKNQDMVVFSFHTCEAHELKEISYNTGVSRLYERN
jgi:hypothetical protein